MGCKTAMGVEWIRLCAGGLSRSDRILKYMSSLWVGYVRDMYIVILLDCVVLNKYKLLNIILLCWGLWGY